MVSDKSRSLYRLARAARTMVVFCLTSQYTVWAACTSGWFGSSCQFKCYCYNESECNEQGVCMWSNCSVGYFGPSCQYVDLASGWSTNTTAQYLTDHNASTCSGALIVDEVSVSLSTAFRFTWLRIQVHTSAREFDFKLQLDAKEELCRRQRNFYSGNTTVDVTCDNTPLFTNVSVSGNIAGTICNIFISGGRNVALKQASNLSSTAGNYSSEKAVDGHRVLGTDPSFCAATNGSPSADWWNLQFSGPQYIFRVTVWGFIDIPLKGFTLLTLSQSGRRLDRLVNSSITDGHYSANLNSTRLAKSLRIERGPGMPFFLCEVEVFGETICPAETYGLECQQNCTCSRDQICNLVTGACSEGCAGFFGYECSTPCSITCVDSLCHQRTGDCLECNAGYAGRLCTDICPPGRYGVECAYPCSTKCADRLCDPVSGFCFKCKEGLEPPRCQAFVPEEFPLWPYFVGILVVILFPVIYLMCLKTPTPPPVPAAESSQS